jgi:hypothetical protein
MNARSEDPAQGPRPLVAQDGYTPLVPSEPIQNVKHVYMALRDVQAHIAKYGIAKLRKNKEQGYAFRGIDDLYNELCSMMADAFLVVIPRVVDRQRELTHKTGTGKPLICTLVTVEYDFVSARDGSMHTARMVGEGFDLSDKSTNKALSASNKYLLIEALLIPVVGKDDGDEDDIRVGNDKAGARADAKDDKKGDAKAGPKAAAATPNLIPEPTGVDPKLTVAAMVKAITEAGNEERLRASFAKYADSIKKWTSFPPKQRKAWLDELTVAKDARKTALAQAASAQPDVQPEGAPKS